MFDNIGYMLLIPTTPVYIRELAQNEFCQKVCISHNPKGFVKINKSPQIYNSINCTIQYLIIACYVKSSNVYEDEQYSCAFV